MQYYLDGFRPGDPAVSDRSGHCTPDQKSDIIPSEVDVLIVGCGPAGLTLAAQLAAFPFIKTCIAEQKPGPLRLGQADGVACRTMEMFQAFGFAEFVQREAYWVNETTFWKPDVNHPENIVRQARIQDTEDGLSDFPHVILNQARVHDFLLDVMRHSPSALEPYYGRRLAQLALDNNTGEQAGSHPVSAVFKHIDGEHERPGETVRARFVVGCDGARSTVRKFLGLRLRGDSANQAWGVMDILAVTDFPDIRFKTIIHSSVEGSLLVIPREGGYLVRLYIELDKLNENERVSSKKITPEHLIAAAQRIFCPYKIDVKEVAWWSVYEIGQRLCEKFDDVPASLMETRHPSAFIVGDACHTHSPKAGQGMNVSMHDSFNLGWKLAAVIQGQADPQLLHTYSAERQSIAGELIEFDRKLATLFSTRQNAAMDPKLTDSGPAEFQRYFEQQGRFTAGTATQYQASMICGLPTYQHLATGFAAGKRFHSAPVVRLADAKSMQLGHTIKADGRWRLFLFAGMDPVSEASRGIDELCEFLSHSSDSPVVRFTPRQVDTDAVFDIRAIFQQHHRDLALETMPAVLLPHKGRYRLCDYEKIFCTQPGRGQDIFELRGINRSEGCMIIVRPDQHVAHVLPLNAYAEMLAFFSRFMLQPRQS